MSLKTHRCPKGTISIILTAVFFLSAGRAFGAPSGLILIPTADVSPPGSFSMGTGVDVHSGGETHCQYTLESALGTAGDMEFGYDAPAGDVHQGAIFVKKGLGRIGGLASAIGLNGIREGTLNPYIAVSSNTQTARVHLGLDYMDRKVRPFAGVEYFLSESLSLIADWVTGSGGASSFGCNYVFGPNNSWGLMSGMIIQNAGDSSQGYINLSRSFFF